MMKQITINRFDRFDLGYWFCFGKEDDAITFSVNKNALLRGFQLYGHSEPRNYDVSAFVTDTRTDEIVYGSTLTQRYEHVVTDVYDVLFRRPVRITENTEYSLFVTINGGKSWCGDDDSWRKDDDSGSYDELSGCGDENPKCGEDRESEIVVDSFVCRFSQSHKSKHSDRRLRTWVRHGQIPALLFLV